VYTGLASLKGGYTTIASFSSRTGYWFNDKNGLINHREQT
jgi:hypothetical protein